MAYKLPWEKGHNKREGLLDDPNIVKEKLIEMKEMMDEIMQDDEVTDQAREMLQYMFGDSDEEHSQEDIIKKAYEYTHFVVAASLSYAVNAFISKKSMKIASDSIVSDELDVTLKEILDNSKDILGDGNGT